MTVRTTTEGSKQIEGYAIVWNSPSVDLGGFTEICSTNMLDRTLKQSPDILALRDHKQELLLGRTTAGTLELRTDAKGLCFTITLPKTAIGDDTAENVRVGNLSGVSFGFSTVEDSWDVGADGKVVRTLLDVDLFEISPTSFPAYGDTSVSTRSCPAELRKRIKAEDIIPDDVDDPDDVDADADDDTDDDDEIRCDCECECEACQAGNCDECTNEDCDGDCEGCPMQDDDRADKLRVRSIFARRMN
jgi:HK97 family phage prohead protease